MAADNHTPNHGEKHSSGQGWQYANGHSGGHGSSPGHNGGHGSSPGHSGGQPPRKPGFHIGEWIPIIVLFCIPSGVTQLIAFFWALSKVITLVKQNKEYQESLKNFGRAATNVARDVTDAVRREVNNATGTGTSAKAKHTAQSGSQKAETNSAKTSSQTYSYAGTGRPTAVKKGKKPTGGSGLVIGGAILTGVFGLSTLATGAEFMESLLMGYYFSDELIGTLTCALFMLGGLIMLFKGIGSNRRKERCLNYLAYIGGNQQVNLAHMAASFDVPVKTLCKDLRWMLSKGVLPTGYLDLAAGKLFLTEAGYRAPEPEEPDTSTAEEVNQQEDDILREIRQVNDDIPDEEMSAKIDRIEEITGKILAYQKAHPDRSGQLRSFLNYYLPTTLKILRAYAQLDAQGIEGENISAAKARIEGMMDQVVAGFEKQLDKLFQDQAMDISSDVQVLENMLKKDGLSDDQQNMTMTL